MDKKLVTIVNVCPEIEIFVDSLKIFMVTGLLSLPSGDQIL